LLKGSYKSLVPAHGVVLLKVGQPQVEK